MRQIEWTLRVLHDAKVKGLDAKGGRVGAVVAGREELRTAEPELDIVGRGREDGLVTEKS